MSYLSPTPNKPIFGLNALKLWLKSDITTPDFLSSPNGSYIDAGGRDIFSLEELHRALHLAILEISLKLDPELEYAATEAGGQRWCISVNYDEIFAGRDEEVRALVGLEVEKRDEVIACYDREGVCQLLEEVRGEIGWLEGEMRRLECHMEVAEGMRRVKSRGSFVFRVLERGWRERDRSGVKVRFGEEEELEDTVMAEVEDMMDGEDEVGRERQEMRRDAEKERERTMRKERLELFKREADVGFEGGGFYAELEEGEQEKMDSPLAGQRVVKDEEEETEKRQKKTEVTVSFMSRE